MVGGIIPQSGCQGNPSFKAIKAKFTSAWLETGGGEQPVSGGYRRQPVAGRLCFSISFCCVDLAS
jgi:hypothetical protein